jgi:hypothetical protein
VLEPKVIDRIEGDATIWEQDPLRTRAADGQLTVNHHTGFQVTWLLPCLHDLFAFLTCCGCKRRSMIAQ